MVHTRSVTVLHDFHPQHQAGAISHLPGGQAGHRHSPPPGSGPVLKANKETVIILHTTSSPSLSSTTTWQNVRPLSSNVTGKSHWIYRATLGLPVCHRTAAETCSEGKPAHPPRKTDYKINGSRQTAISFQHTHIMEMMAGADGRG